MRALLAVLISAAIVAANDRPKTVVESMREYCRQVAIISSARYCFQGSFCVGVVRRKRASTIQEALDSEIFTGIIVKWIKRTPFNGLTSEKLTR